MNHLRMALDHIYTTIGTIAITFTIGYVLAILVDFTKKRTAKNQSIDSMIHELDEMIQNYDDSSKTYNIDENERISITFEPFPTTSIEHVLFSGMFHEFNIETQSQISALFSEIKMANQLGIALQNSILSSLIAVKDFSEIMSDSGDRVDIKRKWIYEKTQKLILELKYDKRKIFKK